jgi:rhodanese-related sulfurtransferase
VADPKTDRLAPRATVMRVPEYAGGGRVVVDATWGTVQPLEIAPGVRTIGELEVVEHLRAGRLLIDTRGPESRALATIPGARGIPHDEIVERAGELGDGPVALFCNGPQCGATPKAIRALLEHGVPAGRLLYYRGGIHDWMTLGLAVEGARAAARA